MTNMLKFATIASAALIAASLPLNAADARERTARGQVQTARGAASGEATVTRCAVRLNSGEEGHAYVMGRNAAHAHLAAICDALLQTEEGASEVRGKVLAPLEVKLQESQILASTKAAATKVDFFTMVRGDD